MDQADWQEDELAAEEEARAEEDERRARARAHEEEEERARGAEGAEVRQTPLPAVSAGRGGSAQARGGHRAARWKEQCEERRRQRQAEQAKAKADNTAPAVSAGSVRSAVSALEAKQAASSKPQPRVKAGQPGPKLPPDSKWKAGPPPAPKWQGSRLAAARAAAKAEESAKSAEPKNTPGAASSTDPMPKVEAVAPKARVEVAEVAAAGTQEQRVLEGIHERAPGSCVVDVDTMTWQDVADE